jgi:hypothetical protein
VGKKIIAIGYRVLLCRLMIFDLWRPKERLLLALKAERTLMNIARQADQSHFYLLTELTGHTATNACW